MSQFLVEKMIALIRLDQVWINVSIMVYVAYEYIFRRASSLYFPRERTPMRFNPKRQSYYDTIR